MKTQMMILKYISNVVLDAINTISKEVVENSAIDIVNNSHEKPDLKLRIENPNLNKQTNECVLGKDAQTCNDSLKKNVLQMGEENVDYKAEETPIEERDAKDISQVASSFQANESGSNDERKLGPIDSCSNIFSPEIFLVSQSSLSK